MVCDRTTGAKKPFRFWVSAGVSTLVVLVTTMAGHAVERGASAPAFTLPVLVNPTPAQQRAASAAGVQWPLLELADYRGRVVYLDFWDTSCRPCREALPLLSALRDEFDRADVEFIAVNTDANPQDALSFLGAHPVSYPVVSDPAAMVANGYGLESLPTAFFIARDGTVQGVHQGFKQQDIAKIRAKLAALSAAGSAQAHGD